MSFTEEMSYRSIRLGGLPATVPMYSSRSGRLSPPIRQILEPYFHGLRSICINEKFAALFTSTTRRGGHLVLYIAECSNSVPVWFFGVTIEIGRVSIWVFVCIGIVLAFENGYFFLNLLEAFIVVKAL